VNSPELAPVHFLLLSALLFVIGSVGVLIRRNILTILMSIELMLNASSLALVAFAWEHQVAKAQGARVREKYAVESASVFVLFIIVLAAIEAAVGLAIAVNLFRRQGTIDLQDIRSLRG
jgi:NADH-quinone oxidoreductase subunit K